MQMIMNGKFTALFSKMAVLAKRLGRATTRQLLILYFVLTEGDMTSAQKAWIYAALLYVLVPGDLLPRRVFGMLGITDDVAAVAYVVKRIKDHVTPQILQKVEMQLDRWFGYEIQHG